VRVTIGLEGVLDGLAGKVERRGVGCLEGGDEADELLDGVVEGERPHADRLGRVGGVLGDQQGLVAVGEDDGSQGAVSSASTRSRTPVALRRR